MHPEDEFAIALVKEGKLGQIEFTRFTLACPAAQPIKQHDFIKEALIFIRSIHQEQIISLYASRTVNQKVLMVTLQFQNQALCHLFFDFSERHGSFNKHFEIVGNFGIYQFNNQEPASFSADFLKTEPYQPRFQQSILDTIWLDELLNKIQRSCIENTIIT